jgi:hypothetical protein
MPSRNNKKGAIPLISKESTLELGITAKASSSLVARHPAPETRCQRQVTRDWQLITGFLRPVAYHL